MLVLGYARELALSFSMQVPEEGINMVIIGRKQMLLLSCLNESLCSGMGIRYILEHIKGRKHGPAPAFIAGPSDLQTREQSMW